MKKFCDIFRDLLTVPSRVTSLRVIVYSGEDFQSRVCEHSLQMPSHLPYIPSHCRLSIIIMIVRMGWIEAVTGMVCNRMGLGTGQKLKPVIINTEIQAQERKSNK